VILTNINCETTLPNEMMFITIKFIFKNFVHHNLDRKIWSRVRKKVLGKFGKMGTLCHKLTGINVPGTQHPRDVSPREAGHLLHKLSAPPIL
jgi:hypothetical protein